MNVDRTGKNNIYIDSLHLSLSKRGKMKCTILTSALIIALAAATPHYGAGSVTHWKPAGKGDCK